MVILPHLGILARYVCGEGYSGTDWGPRVERGMGAERHMAPGRFHIRPAPQNDAEHVYAAGRPFLSRAAPLGRSSAKPPRCFKTCRPSKTVCKLRPFCCSRTTRSRPRSAASRCCLTNLCCKTAACAFLPLLTLLGGGCELLEDTLHIVLGGKNVPHSVRHDDFKRLCADKRGLSAKRLFAPQNSAAGWLW